MTSDSDTSFAALYDTMEPDDLADSPEEVGKRLTAARRSAGLSVEHLATTLGVSPDTIGAWERGEQSPRGHWLSKLAGILGVGLSWLVVGLGDDPTPYDDQDESPAEMIAAVRRRLDAVASELTRLERQLELTSN